ncbi:MAG: riboflavin kinase, partial [Prevotella sp.]|nr:riboflavin kinase [Prevotella sp.]
RKMGFPTANLDVNACQQLLPASGVYAVMVRLKDSVGWKRGMMNIGHRPTFNGTTTSIEVNLFNFTGNLYGQELLVSFISKIRDEHKFDSLEALAQQLKQDKEQINRLFDETYHIQENIINTP